MQLLNDLITAAMELAGNEAVRNHDARLWHLEGGRRCPLGWGGCSQSVYVDLKTGEHDDSWFVLRELQLALLAAEDCLKLLVYNLNHLLRRVQRLRNLIAKRAISHLGGEILYYL